MSVSFHYQYLGKNIFGPLYRPYAKILVRREKFPKIWVERTMIVDTGADYTIFPFSDSHIFGINCKKDCLQEETYGVGGKKTVYLYQNLRIKLDSWEKKIGVGFLEDSSIPALMGRQQFIDTFTTLFANYRVGFSQ